MKFEHILQVYWSKGFFYSGKLYYTKKLEYKKFTNSLPGLGKTFQKLLYKRLELTTFSLYYSNLFFFVDYLQFSAKKLTKTINIILSQISNVNNTTMKLLELNILRKYLTKSYQGYCHALGKPVRGQRTWSNAWSSYRTNNNLRNFITTTRKLSLLKNTSRETKIDYTSVKKKYLNVKQSKISQSHKSHTKTKTWF